MRNIEELGIFGHLEIEEVCNITGVSSIVYSDKNKIVNTGFQSFLEVVTARNQYPFGFGGIFLGDDFGAGTIEEPSPPTDDMTSGDQNVTYTVLDKDIFIDYPAENKLRFTAIVDGSEIQKGGGDSRLLITSASIRNGRGDIVAYKRFAGRSVSPLITLNIRWTITIEEQCEDIPSRYITDILFYVSRELIDVGIGDATSPPELESGEGAFVDTWKVLDGEDTTYVIPVMKWSDGVMEAIEFDGDIPTTEGTTLQYDKNELAIDNVKSYVLEVKSLPPHPTGSIKVCGGGLCGVLEIEKSWVFDPDWEGMTPVGEYNKDEWKNSKWWKLDHKKGSLLGPNEASGVYDPLNPKVWHYSVDNNEIVAVSGENEVRRYWDGEINHLSMTFDQNMYPVFVWEGEGNVYINWYDPQTSTNATTNLGYGISPYVLNPTVNDILSEKTSPLVLVYVEDSTLKIKTQSDRWTSSEIIEEDVTDIISAGYTEMNSMRVVYTKKDQYDNVSIHNIGSERLGAFFTEDGTGGKIEGKINSITITDSKKEVGFFESSIITEVEMVEPTTSYIQYKAESIDNLTEPSIIVGVLPITQKAHVKDSITRVNDKFDDFELSMSDVEFESWVSVINHSAEDKIDDFEMSMNVLMIETENKDSRYRNLPGEFYTPERSEMDIRLQLDSWSSMHLSGDRILSWKDSIKGEVINITPNVNNTVEYIDDYHRSVGIQTGGLNSTVEVEGDWWTFLSIDVEEYEMSIGGVSVNYSDGVLNISKGELTLFETEISGDIMILLERVGDNMKWNINDTEIGESEIESEDVSGWIIQ